MVCTAAAYHDIGYIESYTDHEASSRPITREALPRFGFDDASIAVIDGIIAATKIPQCPANELECIMADADLDVLAQPHCWQRNEALRLERALHG